MQESLFGPLIGALLDGDHARAVAEVRSLGAAGVEAELIVTAGILLAFSRLGRGDLSLSEVDMSRLVNQVVAELKEATAGRSLLWQVLPLPPVQADRSLLHQVWLNLLGNAVKFTTPVQAVVIEVGCRQEEDREVFYVKDNGVGFDMRYANKLFQVFERLHGPQEFEGTGIDLALAQRIINRHGGTIWAEGKVNGGATFFFTLPPLPAPPKRGPSSSR